MKQSKVKRKDNKGITLIALVILASVSIATLTGDNGLIGKANQAKEQMEIAEEKEIVQLASVAAMGRNDSGIITCDVLDEELAKLIRDTD